MREETLFERVKDWLAMLPIYAAYRLVWLMAKWGHPDARDVYLAMWQANLDLPPLPPLSDETP